MFASVLLTILSLVIGALIAYLRARIRAISRQRAPDSDLFCGSTCEDVSQHPQANAVEAHEMEEAGERTFAGSIPQITISQPDAAVSAKHLRMVKRTSQYYNMCRSKGMLAVPMPLSQVRKTLKVKKGQRQHATPVLVGVSGSLHAIPLLELPPAAMKW